MRTRQFVNDWSCSLWWIPRQVWHQRVQQQGPALLFPQYVLLGKLGALTGLPAPLLYHLARVGCGAVLLLAAYRFLAAVITELAVRRLAADRARGIVADLGWTAARIDALASDARAALSAMGRDDASRRLGRAGP